MCLLRICIRLNLCIYECTGQVVAYILNGIIVFSLLFCNSKQNSKKDCYFFSFTFFYRFFKHVKTPTALFPFNFFFFFFFFLIECLFFFVFRRSHTWTILQSLWLKPWPWHIKLTCDASLIQVSNYIDRTCIHFFLSFLILRPLF